MCRRRSRDVRKFLESVQLVISSCYVSSRRQPRRLHELSYARFSKDSHLSPEEFVVLPPVSGFYCFFAMIVDARALCRSSLPSVLFLFRRVIFHRLSTPRSDPISRHEITKSHRARFPPTWNKTRRALRFRPPFSRGHEVHEIQLSRAVRFVFDPWPGRVESSRLYTSTFRPHQTSLATFTIYEQWQEKVYRDVIIFIFEQSRGIIYRIIVER